MHNQIKQMAENCIQCNEEAADKPRPILAIPDYLTKMSVMEMVGIDLFGLRG